MKSIREYILEAKELILDTPEDALKAFSLFNKYLHNTETDNQKIMKATAREEKRIDALVKFDWSSINNVQKKEVIELAKDSITMFKAGAWDGFYCDKEHKETIENFLEKISKL